MQTKPLKVLFHHYHYQYHVLNILIDPKQIHYKTRRYIFVILLKNFEQSATNLLTKKKSKNNKNISKPSKPDTRKNTYCNDKWDRYMN